jgi:predicted AlkP superfamily phosphohydrolase/phosphomutase
VFSIYLAKLQGTYATLGLAEDTWSLSERITTEDEFLEQAYDIHAEREKMLLDALERVRRGAIVCVFDAPDRIQHMFWRFIDAGHPALGGRENTHPDAIRAMYARMDETVGKVLERIDEGTAVYVLSDHGFQPFRRGVDLNAWLREQGYLVLKNGASASPQTYLADVDWSRTRAFAIGLAGIYVNQREREAQGIVAAGDETRRLVQELQTRLTGLVDPETGETAIHEAVPRERVYNGPYVNDAPDLIVGYNVGYRVSWDAAVGKCSERVFSDNTKAWSGDHCIHPQLVPGVLFSNLKLKTEGARIIDLAPTTLDLLGVDTPAYMDGHSLLCEESLRSASA